METVCAPSNGGALSNIDGIADEPLQGAALLDGDVLIHNDVIEIGARADLRPLHHNTVFQMGVPPDVDVAEYDRAPHRAVDPAAVGHQRFADRCMQPVQRGRAVAHLGVDRAAGIEQIGAHFGL